MDLLFEKPEVKSECLRLLKLLQHEDDPSVPQSPSLDVIRLDIHAPNWYRLKVRRYNIRFVYSRAHAKGDDLIQYRDDETPFADTENVILIQFAGYRTDDTYLTVQRRYRNL